MSDPRTVEAAVVDFPSHLESMVKLPECAGCLDIDPLAGAKDQLLVQKLFQNCVARDIFDAFRRQAEKHLEEQVVVSGALWEQRAIEEIVDLMRGKWQPQDAERLRVLVDEQRDPAGREFQVNMAAFQPAEQWF